MLFLVLILVIFVIGMRNIRFCDSFSLQKQWFAPSYLAIDQGPIWDLFMRNVCILEGLDKLGFEYIK